MSALAMLDATPDLSADLRDQIQAGQTKADKWYLDAELSDLQRGLEGIRAFMASWREYNKEAYKSIEAEIAYPPGVDSRRASCTRTARRQSSSRSGRSCSTGSLTWRRGQRHSKITLTMDHYTHTVLGDLANDLENLPALPTTVVSEDEQVDALAATGTDDTYAKRRSKRRSKTGSDRQDGANRDTVRQDRPTVDSPQGAERKPLKLTDINKACQPLASPVVDEADGSRTRNHRIDSPVL